MEYVDLKAEVQRLVDAEEFEKAGSVQAVIEVWPDVKGFRSRWGDLRFCTPEVNDKVDQLELEHQAIEHNDCPMEIWPFVSIGPHDRLYSDPPCFIVADAPHLGFGEIPRAGWEDLLTEAVVSAIVIAKVRNYLEQHQPVLYSEVPEE